MLCPESQVVISCALSESIRANVEPKEFLTIQVMHVCFHCISLEAECALQDATVIDQLRNIVILALNKYVYC